MTLALKRKVTHQTDLKNIWQAETKLMAKCDGANYSNWIDYPWWDYQIECLQKKVHTLLAYLNIEIKMLKFSHGALTW